MTNKLKYLSIGIILLLIGFQYTVVLDQQKSLPSPDWSRSFPSNVDAGNYSKIQNVPTDNGFAISLLDFEQLVFLHCSADLQCVNKWSNSQLNPYKNTWSDGETTYFIKDDSLIRKSTIGEEIKISPNVDNFIKSGDKLAFWLKNQKVIFQQENKQEISYAPEYPVNTGMFVDEHFFIITHNQRNNNYIVLDGSNNFNELFQFHINASESLLSINISNDSDAKFNLLLETQISSGGSTTKVLRTTSFELTENQNPSFKKIAFAEKESGIKLFNIRSPYLYQGETGSHITFSANMFDEDGDKVNKVFVGKYNQSLNEVSAVTKKGDLHVNPVFLNDQTIAYFRLDGKEKELMYSSSTAEKIAQSNTILKGDPISAFYSLFSLLFVGILLVLLSFTWIIPTLLLGYGTLAFLQKIRKSYAFPVSLYVNTIALVGSQFVIFSTMLHPEKILLKAPYLTEVWHVFLVLFIAGIGCILPVILSRTKVTDDNCNILILYTTGLNLFILFMLLGPYFI
ncbi:hypothetical protein [Paenisporosarcina sp. TG20]|uniref:hypothetical protein n=1 Tax=Paenisporosarcina sp. TG20 TaxID=1211706 RepID=UPI00031CAFB7|nr:hypothetical protein [Paenisporosarcina sp. TG20]